MSVYSFEGWLLVSLILLLCALIDRRKNGVNVIITDGDGSQRIVNISNTNDYETNKLISDIKKKRGASNG
jgi:hypothetical protein